MKFPILFCIFALAGSIYADASNDKPTNSTTEPPVTDAPKPPAPTPAPPNPPAPAPAPSPKPVPKDVTLNFSLKNEKNEACALFSFIGSVKLIASDHKKENDTIIYLDTKTVVDEQKSFCDKNNVTSLVLNVDGKADTQINLHLLHSGSSYSLDLVYLNLTVGTTTKSYLYNNTLFKVDDSKSYLCLANPLINLQVKDTKEKAVVSLKNLKVDAFRKETKDDKFRQAVQCENDFPVNDFVPLAVGCALLALVIIVLIAYIVGRRRSRRLTYQSV